MTSSAQLQHDADQARAGLSSALDELRSSVTTTAITNGAMTFAREGSSAVARSAVDRAMAHPLAAMLIGAGVVMLMAGDKGSGAGATPEGIGSSLMNAASSALGATRQTTGGGGADSAKGAAEKVTSAASHATDVASDTYGKARDMLAKGQEQGAQTMADAQKLVADTKTRLEKFADEQPILVAALGLAFGAALGASLPLTDAERTYLGEASRKVAGKGGDVARQLADSVTGELAGSDVPGKVAGVVDSMASTVKAGLPR